MPKHKDKRKNKKIKITSEDIDELKEKLPENILEKLILLFDVTGDRKVNWNDAKAFLGLFFQTAFLAYLIVFMIYRDNLLEMFVTGNWDSNFIYNNVLLGGASAIWAYIKQIFQKKFFSESIARITAETKAKKAEKDLANEKHQNAIDTKNLENKHALEIKEKEIELMQKDVIILTKDEITRIEIIKNEVLEKEKEIVL